MRVEARPHPVEPLLLPVPSGQQHLRKVAVGLQAGAAAGRHRRAQDAVPAVVVGGLRVFPGEHRGEAAGAADVLRDRGGSDAEVVEQHVPLALVVPLGVVVVLVVELLSEPRMPAADDAVVAEPGYGVVLLQGPGQQLLAAAEGVEEPPVVEHLVEVVDVVGVVGDATRLGVLPDVQRGGLVDGVDQLPLQERPLRRRLPAGRRDRNQVPVDGPDHLRAASGMSVVSTKSPPTGRPSRTGAATSGSGGTSPSPCPASRPGTASPRSAGRGRSPGTRARRLPRGSPRPPSSRSGR